MVLTRTGASIATVALEKTQIELDLTRETLSLSLSMEVRTNRVGESVVEIAFDFLAYPCFHIPQSHIRYV